MVIFFSPYTVSPGTRFLVIKASSLPLAIKTPEERLVTCFQSIVNTEASTF
jgi:hypothetical protein